MLSVPESLDRVGGIARSQASHAYEAIRGDILSGRHTPDKKLKIQDLADELGVSSGAVREALSRLVPEQLVIVREQRGFTVAPLSIADLQDLTELRCEIEAIALRRAMLHGDVEWEAGLLAAAHRLRVTPARIADSPAPVNPAWIAAHAAFHAALVAAARSPRLIALHGQLYEQSERYRGLFAHLAIDRDVDSEHHDLVELALARDGEGLVEAVTEHLRKTTRFIAEAASKDAL